MTKLIGVLVISSVLLGCTTGHCRRRSEEPKSAAATATAAPGALDPAASTAPVPNVKSSDSTQAIAQRVFVYKYDGSLQCKTNNGIPLKKMAKELSGIKIFSQVKKPDGMMHIQVCDSPTGIANVYEIPEDKLKQALGLGFKKWNFE